MAHKDGHPPVGHVAAAHIWGVCPSVVGSTSGSRIAASQSMREFGLDGTCSEEALGPMPSFFSPSFLTRPYHDQTRAFMPILYFNFHFTNH